ncbi:MAG TPA: amidohydrolase family protein [Pyrinomonadaceae bacterium]|nr:amidohydrolase family protein [Pyrinomonadaceae bacterium]
MNAIYSARWVLPIASAPIDFGAVAIEGERIVAVGAAIDLAARFPHFPVTDFGISAILPGLVNAHSHLELTVMRGFLEPEEHDFFAWLKKLTIARMAMTADDLFVSAACGAIEAARAGITCVGDSSSVGTRTMPALAEIGLRGIVYQESFGPDPSLAAQNVSGLRRELDAMRALESATVLAGVSPHAPYTVSAPQLELIAQLATADRLPLMMHAAESQAEKALLVAGTGAFAEGLRKRNIDWRAPGVSTIQYLAQHGIMETRPLLAHCITVDDQDIETIRTTGASVAHCPKSNAKLRHGAAPFAKFLGAGLKVGLGSDSVASNNTCDILEEARFATLLARVSGTDFSLDDRPSQTEVCATDALLSATLGGARALGLDREIGSLKEGMQADLVVVRLDGSHQQPVTNPVDALIFSSSARDVRMTIVAGKEIFRDGNVSTADEMELQGRLKLVRDKLEEAGKQNAVSSEQ